MSFKKLIPKLLQDTEDWNNDMRIQTAQLVYQFLHEIPDRSTELPTVMEILIFQAGDDQAAVRTWVRFQVKCILLKHNNLLNLLYTGFSVSSASWGNLCR